MKKTIHIKPQNRLVAVTVAVVLLISLALSGILRLDAAAFYGTLYGSSAGVDQDANSDMPLSPEEGEVWAGKNVTQHPDVLTSGKFDVELSALGHDYEAEFPEFQQYDVVFVLDASNSMNTGGKLGEMITAANAAIGTLLNDEDPTDDIYNRIAVVTFNRSADILTGWTEKGSDYQISSISLASSTNIQHGLVHGKIRS